MRTTHTTFAVCTIYGEQYVKIGFLKEVSCSPRLYLLGQKYRKNSNIVKYYYNFK